MRVKDTFTGKTLDISVAGLLAVAGHDRAGQVESLQDRVEQLTKVVGFLLERSGLTDEEILRLTGTDYRYTVARGNPAA